MGLTSLKQRLEKLFDAIPISFQGMTTTQIANVENGLTKLEKKVLGLVADFVVVPRKQLEEMKSDVTLITKYDLIKFLLGDENECVC